MQQENSPNQLRAEDVEFEQYMKIDLQLTNWSQDSLAYGTKVAAIFTKLSVTACDIM